MPVFQVSTRSTNGVSATAPLAPRSKTKSSQSLSAWSSAQATAAAARPSGERSPEVGRRRRLTPFALRMASHSRSACASRGVTSGYCGSLPTAGEIFHERAHLRPSASLVDDRDARHLRQAEGVGRAFALDQRRRRGDADFGEVDAEHRLEQLRVRHMDDRVGFERGADALAGALDLQRAGDDAAHQAHLAPFLGELVVAPGRRHLGEQFEMHRGVVRAVALAPGLLGGEAQHRREPGHGAAEQMVDHGERGLARRRRDRIAVERVLADVEIERRQVGGHEMR